MSRGGPAVRLCVMIHGAWGWLETLGDLPAIMIEPGRLLARMIRLVLMIRLRLVLGGGRLFGFDAKKIPQNASINGPWWGNGCLVPFDSHVVRPYVVILFELQLVLRGALNTETTTVPESHSAWRDGKKRKAVRRMRERVAKSKAEAGLSLHRRHSPMRAYWHLGTRSPLEPAESRAVQTSRVSR